MYYFKTILISIWIYIGIVSILRIAQTCIFGCSSDWYSKMFGSQPYPLFDWWWVIIPSVTIVALFARFASARTSRRAFWVFTALVVLLIGGTYL